MIPSEELSKPSVTKIFLQQQMRAVLEAFETATKINPRKVFRAAMKKDSHLWAKYWTDNGSFRIESHDRILQWMSDRWPEGVQWPPEVLRPDPQPLPVEPAETEVEA